MLRFNGADEVFIDNGSIANEVRLRRPEGYNKVLELVGPAVLEDSLKCVKEQGIVCVTGVAGGQVQSLERVRFHLIRTVLICL
jgi:NADPH:quinone reductase-like Zn-dependent oxidoreductase